MPEISVIIPAFNCGGFISEAIISVLSQTYTDLEIIVVDDGSTDNTKEIVSKFAGSPFHRITQTPVSIRYLYQKNRGLPGSRNRGIKEAAGKYVVFLDADDELVPKALENCITACSNNNAQWCITDILRIEDGKKEIRESKIPENEYFFNILRNDFIRRAFFFSKQSLIDIGLYDESLVIREDWDLNIRMIHSKKQFSYINEPLYIYKIREKSLVKNNTHEVLHFTLKLLQKHHKRLADEGNKQINRIYSQLMWSLARDFFYKSKDFRKTFYCAWESLRYE